MAEKKITELTAISAVTSVDLLEMVDDPSGTPASVKATVAQLFDNDADWATTGTVDLSGASSVDLGDADGGTLNLTNELNITSSNPKVDMIDGATTCYVSGDGGHLNLYSHSTSRNIKFGEQASATQRSEIVTLNGAYRFTAASNIIVSGTGSPEGVTTAPVGSMFLRTDGGTGTTLYIKESGTGNTGWVAK